MIILDLRSSLLTGHQFLTGTYISEIAPPRIRGFLLLFYSVWYGVGQLMATTALRVMRLDNPKIWLPLIYSEWATIGIMFLIYCFIPESPCKSSGHSSHAESDFCRVVRQQRSSRAWSGHAQADQWRRSGLRRGRPLRHPPSHRRTRNGQKWY
jgi:hypothetical protein